MQSISDGATGRNLRGNRTMAYDALDRLKSTASPMFGNGTTGTTSFEYDALDNLTHTKVTGGNQVRDQYYCYDANWRLTNLKTGSCSGASVVGLGYDVQGNLANKNGTLYTFDFGNRLRSVSTTPAVSYVYDGNGRRVRDLTNASRYSLYNQAGQLMYASDLRLGTTSQYLYLGGSLVATRQVVTSTGTASTTYQHTDALGTPVVITNASRAVVEKTDYEPYGWTANRTSRDGPGYTGHVEDAATGLLYMQNRYMDPQIGRFLSVDPVTALSNPAGMFNRYDYAANNPYKFVDPDGRRSCTTFTHIAGGTGNCDPIDEDRNYGPWRSSRRTGPSRFCPECSLATNGGNGGVDLKDSEGTGHTIEKHVGKSDAYLLNKMNEPFSIGPVDVYPRDWSTFSSLGAANKLVSSTISTNQGEVSAWLASPLSNIFSRTLILNKEFLSPTGRVAYRKGRGDIDSPEPVNFTTGYGVRVVLRLSPTSPTGFTILTAFPTR